MQVSNLARVISDSLKVMTSVRMVWAKCGVLLWSFTRLSLPRLASKVRGLRELTGKMMMGASMQMSSRTW